LTLPTSIIGGCYRLIRPLGVGGMGTVYEAQHLRLGGRVAVKILSPQFAADPKFRERFRREARAASQIHHPNVVQLIDFGETPNNSVFIAMELLEGRDLHHILRKHLPAPFPWPRARNLLAQAADALAAVHRCGIVHRDVKPSNIFVLEGPGVHDFVKLLDFGIAKLVTATATADSAFIKNLTGTGEIFGTAKYMAPEQAYGTSDDPRVDVYSLGVVAYELLTGRVPFTGESNFQIVTRHVYDEPRPPRELRAEIPAALEAVVLRALEKHAERRFATMEEFGHALRAVADPAVPGGNLGGPSVRPAIVRGSSHTDAETLLHHVARVGQPVQSRGGAKARVQTAVSPTAAPVVVPSAVPPVAQTLAPAVLHALVQQATSSTQRMTDLPRAEAPTGPLARRHDSVLDDTAREIAMVRAAAPGTWRLLALAVTGAVAVGSLSAVGAMFVAGSGEDEPVLMEEQPAIAPSGGAEGAHLPILGSIPLLVGPTSAEGERIGEDERIGEGERIADAEVPSSPLEDSTPPKASDAPVPEPPAASEAPVPPKSRPRPASRPSKSKRKTTFDPFQ
jgi:serine/threonine protein kinase